MHTAQIDMWLYFKAHGKISSNASIGRTAVYEWFQLKKKSFSILIDYSSMMWARLHELAVKYNKLFDHRDKRRKKHSHIEL